VPSLKKGNPCCSPLLSTLGNSKNLQGASQIVVKVNLAAKSIVQTPQITKLVSFFRDKSQGSNSKSYENEKTVTNSFAALSSKKRQNGKLMRLSNYCKATIWNAPNQ